MKNNFKTLIFYQSISSIDYILSILNNNQKNTCIIFITGGVHFLEICKKLQLKKKYGVKILEITQPNILNLFRVLNFFYKIKFSEKIKKIKSYEFNEAYFNSFNTDFVTPIILSTFNIKKIYFYKHQLKKKRKNKNIAINLKWKIKKLFLRLLLANYEISVNYNSNDGFRRIFYKVNNKKIIIEKKSIINLSKFLIPLEFKSKKKRVIYLDSMEEKEFGSDIPILVAKIFSLLNKFNFEIIVKKHGKISMSNFLYRYKSYHMSSSVIPIELYNLKDIDLVIGFTSTGLVNVLKTNSKIKSISFIPLFNNDKKTVKMINYKDYINELDQKNKIFFPNNFKEFEFFLNTFDLKN